MSTQTTASYSATVTATIEALKASTNADNKLQQAGLKVREFFGTKEALRAVKKQYEADAIIPALDKKYIAYLHLDIARGDKSEQAETNRKNKATARGFVSSYFSKIESHAFPSEKKEATPREPVMAFIEDFIKVAKKGQKLESAPFNLVKVMALMNATLKEMNVSEADMNDDEV